jgi:hypothetical protein
MEGKAAIGVSSRWVKSSFSDKSAGAWIADNVNSLIDSKRQPCGKGRTNFSASLQIISTNRFWH